MYCIVESGWCLWCGVVGEVGLGLWGWGGGEREERWENGNGNGNEGWAKVLVLKGNFKRYLERQGSEFSNRVCCYLSNTHMLDLRPC